MRPRRSEGVQPSSGGSLRSSPAVLATGGLENAAFSPYRESAFMRRPQRSTSIVLPEASHDTHLVDDFGGRVGRAWREPDEEATYRETLILL